MRIQFARETVDFAAEFVATRNAQQLRGLGDALTEFLHHERREGRCFRAACDVALTILGIALDFHDQSLDFVILHCLPASTVGAAALPCGLCGINVISA
jgi:hypothetical protein